MNLEVVLSQRSLDPNQSAANILIRFHLWDFQTKYRFNSITCIYALITKTQYNFVIIKQEIDKTINGCSPKDVV